MPNRLLSDIVSATEWHYLLSCFKGRKEDIVLLNEQIHANLSEDQTRVYFEAY